MSINIHEWGNVTVSLGWTASPGLVGRAIRRFDSVTWFGQQYNSRFNHVFWLFDFERGPSLIYESHIRGGVQITPLEQLEAARKSGKVLYYYLRELDLDQAKCSELWNACAKLHGANYDKRHILGLFLWIKVYGRNMLKRPGWLNWALNNVYICSELTEVTARAIGLDLCGTHSTPVTSTPESQFMQVVGVPSEVTYCPCKGEIKHVAWPLNTRTVYS